MREESGVAQITSARRSRSEDVRSREIRYLISMGIRTVCFILAIVVDGPLRWVLIAAAFLLPYVAVVAANAGRGDRSGPGPAPFVSGQERAALEGAVIIPAKSGDTDRQEAS